jgi:hypothetical protein
MTSGSPAEPVYMETETPLCEVDAESVRATTLLNRMVLAMAFVVCRPASIILG